MVRVYEANRAAANARRGDSSGTVLNESRDMTTTCLLSSSPSASQHLSSVCRVNWRTLIRVCSNAPNTRPIFAVLASPLESGAGDQRRTRGGVMNCAAIWNPTDVELSVRTKTIHINTYPVQSDKSTSESVSPRITISRSDRKSRPRAPRRLYYSQTA
jgi:hypothetical protein